MGDEELLKSALSPESCLSLDEIHEFVEGNAPENVRTHISSCPACQAEAGLMSRFMESQLAPEEQGAVAWITGEVGKRLQSDLSRPRRWNLRWNFILGGALACCAAIVIAVGIGHRVNPAASGPVFNPQEPEVLRSTSISGLAPSGDVAVPPQELTWKAGAGSTSFRVEILQVDGSQLWAGTSAGQSISIPESVRRIILPRKTIQWRVISFDSSGRILSTSPNAHVRYVPPESKKYTQ